MRGTQSIVGWSPKITSLLLLLHRYAVSLLLPFCLRYAVSLLLSWILARTLSQICSVPLAPFLFVYCFFYFQKGVLLGSFRVCLLVSGLILALDFHSGGNRRKYFAPRHTITIRCARDARPLRPPRTLDVDLRLAESTQARDW